MGSSSTKSAVPEACNSAAAERTLIICYGNPMRGDDGLAWHVAEHLESHLNKASTELLCRVQLTPELAYAMGRAERVLFVDAAAEGKPGEIRWSSISANENDLRQSVPNFTHQSSPQGLLTLCHTLYGVAPSTTVVTAAVASCELGEPLSEKVKAAVLEIAASIEAWLHKTIESR